MGTGMSCRGFALIHLSEKFELKKKSTKLKNLIKPDYSTPGNVTLTPLFLTSQALHPNILIQTLTL